ncbi:hypothetical protein V1477_020827 [Vespula maculifrons]|uniref:Uncharacterized protein n=1 Tax=Vespula maculifrons TaxID=7453 RepID=A0ABD2AN19_VESMC
MRILLLSFKQHPKESLTRIKKSQLVVNILCDQRSLLFLVHFNRELRKLFSRLTGTGIIFNANKIIDLIGEWNI